jgi:hypothetical protein
MKRLLLAAVVFPQLAFAQQPAMEYHLKLTLPEIQTIGAALSKRPYEEVAPLLANLSAQVAAQQQALKPPVAETGK